MPESFYAKITPVQLPQRPGGPVDPGWVGGIGRPGGPVDPGYGVEGPGGPVDPGWGVDEGGVPTHPIAPGGPSFPARPAHPIALPPLPGINPPPGKPSHPIYVPFPKPPGSGGTPEQPIYIEEHPEHPITLPPGTIWPPLPPTLPGVPDLGDKTAILVWVVGVGARWFIYDPSALPPKPSVPPGKPDNKPPGTDQPQPKLGGR